MTVIDERALAQLFLEARTHNGWVAGEVDDATLHRLFEIAHMGPTSANSQPMRVVFVKSKAAKEKLRPAMAPGNLEKTMAAPVTAIVAYDKVFFEKMAVQFPAVPTMGQTLAGQPEAQRHEFAVLNGALGGAYLILAARALGLDCGPMLGFDKAKVDEAFLADKNWRSMFLVNIGHGDASKLYPRGPRLSFDEACQIV